MNTPANAEDPPKKANGDSRSVTIQVEADEPVKGTVLEGRTVQPEDDPQKLVPMEYHSDNNLVPEEEYHGGAAESPAKAVQGRAKAADPPKKAAGDRRSVTIQVEEDEPKKATVLQGRTVQPEDDPNKLVPTVYNSDNNLVPEKEYHGDESKDQQGEEIDDMTAEAAKKPPKNMSYRSSEYRFEKALNEDIYSVMYTADRFSIPFFFAMLVFMIQFTILVLIFIGLVDTTEDPPTSSNGETNRLKLPVDVERTVRIAQGCGVILIINFTAKEGDLIKGCSRVFNGYDKELIKDHTGATKIKWAMSSLFQASSGFFMIMNLFILLMQSTTVVGMCLNFAALHFVQDIDDVAFAVAETGLVGQVIQAEVKGVGDIMTTAANIRRTLWMRRFLLGTIVTALYVFWIIFSNWQLSGKFACNVLLLQFGDAYDPDLAYYSGGFIAEGLQSSRPKYVDLSGTYKMRYSRSNKAWVLEPNTPEKGLVVIKSSETESFDVTTIADQTWFHNTTGGFVPVDWFSLTCHECNENRCHTDRGTCNENHACMCHEGFFGVSCETETPKCPFYAVDFRTRGTLANVPGGSFFFDNQFLSADVKFNHRFLYIPFDINAYAFSAALKVQYFMIFTGRRWMIMGAPYESSALTYDEFFDYLNTTKFWNASSAAEALQVLAKSRLYSPRYYSSPVDYGTPTWAYDPTAVTWVFAKPQENHDDSLFFDATPDDDDTLSARFLCSACSFQYENGTVTEGLATCQNKGRCRDGFEGFPFGFLVSNVNMFMIAMNLAVSMMGYVTPKLEAVSIVSKGPLGTSARIHTHQQ
ncbi:expressed unknown protein [Seminavis robusta]|uniref:EGF-like domain-containing protein n=1 Tax=Seminavis robusta TaxID=568900 RepID=A0A9N8DIT9_9STRA|nr:expressed unknown protein [Seminavis robusta]|eukprot:Sro165_g073870.1 n/a (809) ;mRNA; r:47432-50444